MVVNPQLPDGWKPEEWEEDPFAVQESTTWPGPEELEGTKDVNRLRLLRHSGAITICFIWLFSMVFVASMGAWVWHFLTPWSWLTETQLSKNSNGGFSSSFGAIVSAFAQRHISK